MTRLFMLKTRSIKRIKKHLHKRPILFGLKTNGYHFECRDKPGYLYAVDNLKLTEISGSQIQIKANHRVL